MSRPIHTHLVATFIANVARTACGILTEAGRVVSRAEEATCQRCRRGLPAQPEREATLELDGRAGRTSQRVIIVAETPTRYRIRTPSALPVRLPGRLRYLKPGQTALVPRYAVRVR